MKTVETTTSDQAPAEPTPRDRWLWPNVIPRGSLVVLDGDPCVGKSLITVDLAARLTRGGPWPDGSAGAGPGNVVLYCGEDLRDDTVRPRLAAAGADQSRVYVLGTPDDPQEPPTLPAEMVEVEAVVRLTRPGLLVFDPLSLFLASPGMVRPALTRLIRLAAHYWLTIVLVRHLTKDTRARALCRGLGSMSIVGAARLEFLATRDPSDASRFILTPPKANRGRLPPSQAYRVGVSNGEAVIEWLGPAPSPSDDANGRAKRAKAEAPGVVMAADWLTRALDKGERPAAELLEEALALGISERTLDRAKAALYVRSRVSNKGGKRVWKWSLPSGSEFEDLPDLSELPPPRW
jgi:AAA domain